LSGVYFPLNQRIANCLEAKRRELR